MELDIDFFSIDNKQVARQGRVLISEPFLNDTYFKRSVVLLTEHSDEGTVGFVLNKPVDLSVTEVINDFPDIDTEVSIGGPVNTNTIHYIHTLGDTIPNSVKILDNLYWGGDFEVIKDMISAGLIKGSEIRFFLGYAGWSPKQLENELSENAWLISEMKPDHIMQGPGDDLWKEILEKSGDKYKTWVNFPENPSLN
ncbi:MAG TPA: YqgE/AlgH family protein [Bacteroides sp.]|nr:YqgE/AlgH family protein [Bacteroides sp.]